MKRSIKLAIVLCICVALSVVIEVLGFNFRTLKSDTKDLSYSVLSTDEKHKTTLKLDVDHAFINKLVIDYEAEKDVPYSIVYSHSSLYGQESSDTISDIFDDSFSKSVTNLHQDVSDIVITFNQSDAENIKINQITMDNGFHFNVTRFTIIILSLLLVYSLYHFYKSGFKTEKLHLYFTVISLILGGITILAQPSATFYSFDDQIHFQNVVDITGGSLNYNVGEYHLTEANVKNSAGHYSINSIEEQKVQNDLFNSGSSKLTKKVANIAPTYDKFSYIPMAIGYHFAKLIGLPFTVCFIIGKFFNLLTYTLLLAYAIKTIKIGKRLLLVIALFPTNIFLATQYSYDPAVFAGITVFFAHIINLFIDKESKFDFKTAVIVLLSLSFACFAKAIYAPLLLLTLFIPKTKFDTKNQSILVKAGLSVVTLLLLATFILPAISGEMASDLRGGNTSVSGQLSLIMTHPFDYASILGDTALGQFGSKFFNSAAISDFAYVSNPVITIFSNFYYLFLFILFFVFITDNKDNTLKPKQKAAILILNAIVIVFIWTALYLSYTPVGESTIFGVQDRYFLPLLFSILLCLQPRKIENKIAPRSYNAIITAIPAIITYICIFASIVIPYAF